MSHKFAEVTAELRQAKEDILVCARYRPAEHYNHSNLTSLQKVHASEKKCYNFVSSTMLFSQMKEWLNVPIV